MLAAKPNRAIKRDSIAPSHEGNISGFCSQSNFAAMPNRRLVLLDKTPLLWHKSPAGLCAHGALGDIVQRKKRYSISPSCEGEISYYF